MQTKPSLVKHACLERPFLTILELDGSFVCSTSEKWFHRTVKNITREVFPRRNSEFKLSAMLDLTKKYYQGGSKRTSHSRSTKMTFKNWPIRARVRILDCAREEIKEPLIEVACRPK